MKRNYVVYCKDNIELTSLAQQVIVFPASCDFSIQDSTLGVSSNSGLYHWNDLQNLELSADFRKLSMKMRSGSTVYLTDEIINFHELVVAIPIEKFPSLGESLTRFREALSDCKVCGHIAVLDHECKVCGCNPKLSESKDLLLYQQYEYFFYTFWVGELPKNQDDLRGSTSAFANVEDWECLVSLEELKKLLAYKEKQAENKV